MKYSIKITYYDEDSIRIDNDGNVSIEVEATDKQQAIDTCRNGIVFNARIKGEAEHED